MRNVTTHDASCPAQAGHRATTDGSVFTGLPACAGNDGVWGRAVRIIGALISIVLLTATPLPAVAEDYPTRPITLVVPFPPGGTNNIMARAVADKMSQALGQPVVVENRAGGAAGNLATRQFTRSAPDGYTLLLAYTSNLASGPNLFPDVGYDPRKDFAPVGLIAAASAVLVAHPSLPAHSVSELVALMRKTGPTFQFASPGVGTVNHLAAELFALKAGVKFTHIPYKSSGAAMADLIGGHNLVQFTPIPVARGPISGGLIRALGVTGIKRAILLPDVPTIAESGLPGFEVSLRYGIVAPAGTPQPIVDKLNATLNAALATDEVKRRILNAGAETVAGTPADYAAVIDREETMWATLIKSIGLKIEN
jgi:tripartite-type tricarboxylate transporter receptor subunit TctC